MEKVTLPFIKYTESPYSISLPMKNGVPLQKGVACSQTVIDRNKEELGKWIEYITLRPDVYLDFIKPEGSKFNFYLFQRIVLRCAIRFPRFYITAARAFSKSFICMLAMFMICVFRPGTKAAIVAPKKNQGAQVATQKLKEFPNYFPLLGKEIKGGWDGINYGRDYVTVKFRNQSILEVVGAMESSLGGRRNCLLIDETADHDSEIINMVVLPLLNVPRFCADGTINPNEPQQVQLYASAAKSQASFGYEKLIDLFELAIINPKLSCVLGYDYRVSLGTPLLSDEFVQEMKLSKTYTESQFASQYLSVWLPNDSDAWFDFNRINKHRKKVNPEWKANQYDMEEFGSFYVLGFDVGRVNDQSIVSVIKVRPTIKGYYCQLVNLIVLGTSPETKSFQIQARDFRKLVKDFQPRAVGIDINGLGRGIADLIIAPMVDDRDGTLMPALGFVDNKDYIEIQPKDAARICYGIIANTALNSQMWSGLYSRINSGLFDFLVPASEAKIKLMSTKKGQKMNAIQRAQRLLPHTITDKLMSEMGNKKLKSNVAGQIVLEDINSSYHDDRLSSLAIGHLVVSYLEQDYIKKESRKKKGIRKLIFGSRR